MKLEKELAELNKKREELVKKVKVSKSRLKFECGCGKMHMIQSCDVIQTHWYEGPHGCTGGDMWHEGELQIVCPNTKLRNRLLYDSTYKIEWNRRDEYECSAERQFKHNFKDLFKSVIDEHEDRRNGGRNDWVNNYYVDQNHEKFGIKIPKRAYERNETL